MIIYFLVFLVTCPHDSWKSHTYILVNRKRVTSFTISVIHKEPSEPQHSKFLYKISLTYEIYYKKKVQLQVVEDDILDKEIFDNSYY